MAEMTVAQVMEITNALKWQNIKYMIISGLGLDGKRGYQSRPHQDLDVLCLNEDYSNLNKMFWLLGYSGELYNHLYKLHREDGGKVDLGLLVIEGDEAVSYGRIAITRFPKNLFENPQRGCVEGIEFNIAPNELLKTWGLHSQHKADAEYVRALPVDEEIFKKINRVLRSKL